MKWMKVLTVVLVVALLAVGCVKNYRVTQPLEQPLDRNYYCEMGAITDALPADFKEEDKPSTEFIEKLRSAIVNELSKTDFFPPINSNDSEEGYDIKGSILDFKKGSGFLRFLFGALAGSSKLTIELSLTDRASDSVIFAGNFTQTVSGWAEAGDATCKKVAKDFAKALKNEIKEQEKKTAQEEG